MYFVYILRCDDNSLYTGITNDWERRISQHFKKDKLCAKYTKSHDVIKLESLWSVNDKSTALKAERKIKSLSKIKKEKLISQELRLCDIFDNSENFEYEKLNCIFERHPD